jgi:RNA polymerase sigma-70 factor (ECF subfamily)
MGDTSSTGSTANEQAEGERREAALIASSRLGDRNAFNALVELHQAGTYAVALRMLGDPDAAADVTQDAFFSAFRAIGSFKGTSFKAWLYRIVSNGCFDYFRAHGRRPVSSLEEALAPDYEGDAGGTASDAHLPQSLIDPSWDPERVALQAEQIAQIEAALLRLVPEQRLALVLSDVQGLSYDEIATIMGTSLGTVKSRIARGRAHLRDLLLRQGELFGRQRRPGSGGGRE